MPNPRLNEHKSTAAMNYFLNDPQYKKMNNLISMSTSYQKVIKLFFVSF